MTKKQDPMSAINQIANKDLQKDEINEEEELLKQIKNIFFQKFWNWKKEEKSWTNIEKKIKKIKPDDYQKFIHELSKLEFTDEEFWEFIMPLQQYWSYKNLTPKERELQQTLVEMLQLFTEQEWWADLIKKGKDIWKLFDKRMNKKNEALFDNKPIEILKDIDPEFKIDGSDIQWTFI